jgi:hypothetical protein
MSYRDFGRRRHLDKVDVEQGRCMEKFVVAELPAVIVVWSHGAAVT